MPPTRLLVPFALALGCAAVSDGQQFPCRGGGCDAGPARDGPADDPIRREERCGNGIDDDGDGLPDEGCLCTPGETQPCFSGPPELANVGACRTGTQTCEAGNAEFTVWGDCVGAGAPSTELCDEIDNDCDGQTDEGCSAACVPSVEVCDGIDDDCDGLVDEDCPGACVPRAEACDGADNDCDGLVDEGCSACTPRTEVCSGGGDEDCDGAVDCADSDCDDDVACNQCAIAYQGRYSGPFLGVVTIMAGMNRRTYEVDGTMTFQLEQSPGAGVLEIVGGSVSGTAEGAYPFDGQLTGSLNCATRRMDAMLTNGSVTVGTLGTYAFEGPVTATYNATTHSLTGGIWAFHQTGGGPGWGGVGTGICSATFAGP